MKSHLKRLAAPKAWQIQRKGIRFITKQTPGPHKIEMSMPLSVILKEVLNYAGTSKEVKKILNSNDVKIDGKTRRDFRFPIGLFDTIEFANINECFRIILNRQGKLDLVKINHDECKLKPCKITGKTMVNGKLQLNLYDGKNVLVGKNDYNVGDTILFSVDDNKISKRLKLEKKSTIFLTGGKHIGEVGNVEDIAQNKIIYKDDKGDLIETLKDYAFVIGEGKPVITIGQK